MITTMYKVKLYRGMFDGTSNSIPNVDTDETQGYYVGFRLLCSLNGFDYVCLDASAGVAKWGVDTKKDELIEDSLHSVSGLVTRYCNKVFTGFPINEYESVGIIYGVSMITDLSAYFTTQFYVGDSILILGSKRNDGFYRVTDVTDTVLTIEGEFILQIPDDNHQMIVAIPWPKGLEIIGARMVEYDVYRRNDSPGLASEGTGSYSSSKETVDIMGTGYPSSVVAGIGSFKCPRIADGLGLQLNGFRVNS